MTRASTLHSAFVGRMDGPYNIISVGNESPIEIKTTSLINFPSFLGISLIT